MKLTLILLGIAVYLVIGRIIMNLLWENDFIEFHVPYAFLRRTVAGIIFPIILVLIGINKLGDWISSKLF